MSTLAQENLLSEKDCIAKTLSLGGGVVQLPDPNTVVQWEVNPVYLPSVSGDCIEAYFNDLNNELGIKANECKALRLGKGLALSGHVLDLHYSGISSFVNQCFVKSRCVRQTCLRELPYKNWVIIEKNGGKVHNAYCSCFGGISGCCKHIAALLYSLLEISEKGLNQACTSKKQEWGRTKRFHEPDFLPEIPIKRLSSNCEIEEIEPRKKRFLFDPRAPSDRNPEGKCVFNLKKLAMIGNGNSAILKHLGIGIENTVNIESDQNVVLEEEVATTQIPLAPTEIAETLKKITLI